MRGKSETGSWSWSVHCLHAPAHPTNELVTMWGETEWLHGVDESIASLATVRSSISGVDLKKIGELILTGLFFFFLFFSAALHLSLRQSVFGRYLNAEDNFVRWTVYGCVRRLNSMGDCVRRLNTAVGEWATSEYGSGWLCTTSG